MTPARPTSEPVAGSGRDGDDRSDAAGIGPRPPIADILESHIGRVCPLHEGDDLAGIETRCPPAEGDDAVMAAVAEDRDAISDVLRDCMMQRPPRLGTIQNKR